MVAYAERALGTWRDGEVRNLHDDVMRMTLEIVAKVLFDTDVANDAEGTGAAVDTLIRECAVRLRRPFAIPDAIPLPGNRRYRRALRHIDDLVYRIIREHRRAGREGGDILSVLMQTRDEGGRRPLQNPRSIMLKFPVVCA